MADDRRIVEAIDACRPGSNDLDAPELKELATRLGEDPRVAATFESLQRWDVTIGEAMDRVPVPKGLRESIAASLMAAEPQSGEVVPTVPSQAPPSARRAWLGLAVAASVATALASVWYWSRDVPVTAEDLWMRVDAWRHQIDPSAWRSASSAPEGYPASPRVLGRRFGWQTVGLGVVAYDLAGPDSLPAVLLVVRARIEGLPQRPPTSATWTQNRSMAAWQSGRLLYVLVVDGPPARYRRLLDLRRPPLA
jgi:hypothetical protein